MRAKTVPIRVVSYNIHRAIGVDRRFHPERIVEILRHHDADLVLLQEVDEGAPRSREMDLGTELARILGYGHVAVGHNVTLRRGRYGNATLSRFPIERERNIDLTVGGRKRRGCQHTRVRVPEAVGPDRVLDVFNLHLGLLAKEREHQVRLLSRASEFTALRQADACVVGGDFNDWRALLRPILTGELAFRCVTPGENGHRRAFRTSPSFSPQGALD
ncbi:MAG: endonuclease/exonuclease/phosphatase family protein, partial [Candidatus Rokubacteria bacterium]|nr:endonuclease/exonuclease/phosphatase family protein [Candidatus Rokubacteria bacterium]